MVDSSQKVSRAFKRNSRTHVHHFEGESSKFKILYIGFVMSQRRFALITMVIYYHGRIFKLKAH